MPKIVDREQRRTEIIHALWQVIYERGIDAVSFRSVAAAAGVSVGRIQHYFADRTDLVVAGCEQIVAGAAPELLDDSAQDDPWAALEAVVAATIPTTEAFRLGSAVWHAYVASAVADPAVAAIVTQALRDGEAAALDLLATATGGGDGLVAEARRLIAMGEGLGLRVLVGAVDADAAQQIVTAEIARVRREHHA